VGDKTACDRGGSEDVTQPSPPRRLWDLTCQALATAEARGPDMLGPRHHGGGSGTGHVVRPSPPRRRLGDLTRGQTLACPCQAGVTLCLNVMTSMQSPEVGTCRLARTYMADPRRQGSHAYSSDDHELRLTCCRAARDEVLLRAGARLED